MTESTEKSKIFLKGVFFHCEIKTRFIFGKLIFEKYPKCGWKHNFYDLLIGFPPTVLGGGFWRAKMMHNISQGFRDTSKLRELVLIFSPTKDGKI